MKRRLLALLSALSLLLCGCARTPAATVSQEAPAPETLSWYVHYNWFSTAWGGNLTSDTITQNTGVTVDFITPSGNEREKLASLIASDTLPDLVTLGWWEPQLAELIGGGKVYALNELAQTYCPEFFDAADKTALSWYTEADGNVYCYPNSSYSSEDFEDGTLASNQTFLVRRDIYEAIGSPDMTTPEGFASAVRAAAAAFPTVDGSTLIPVGAHAFTDTGCDSFDKFLQNFLAVPCEKDGAVYDRTTDPDYVAWLKMFRQLAQEGYLTDDIFVDQRAQMDEKIAQGRYFCMIYQRTDLVSPQKRRYQADPASAYIAVDGPRNAAGDAHRLPGGGVPGWTVTLVSKKCADPARAIRFMTYLMGEEGQKLISVGVEGVSYTLRDGQAVYTPDVQELYRNDYSAFVQQIGADDAYWMLQDNAMQSHWRREDDPALSQMLEWAIPYTVYTAQYDLPLVTGSAEERQDRKIQELWGKTLPELLTAPDEAAFDALLAAFVKERDALGFDAVQTAKTTQMRDAKRRLGMEP